MRKRMLSVFAFLLVSFSISMNNIKTIASEYDIDHYINEYVKALIDNNEIDDKEYDSVHVVPVFGSELEYQMSMTREVDVFSENTDKAIRLISKEGNEVEQTIIFPYCINEDGDLTNALRGVYEGHTKDLNISDNLNVITRAYYSYYRMEHNGYRGPFYRPVSVSVMWTSKSGGYPVSRVIGTFANRGIFHDVDTGQDIGTYVMKNSVVSVDNPSTGYWYPGNMISMSQQYGFPVLTNGVDTHARLLVSIRYIDGGVIKVAEAVTEMFEVGR